MLLSMSATVTMKVITRMSAVRSYQTSLLRMGKWILRGKWSLATDAEPFRSVYQESWPISVWDSFVPDKLACSALENTPLMRIGGICLDNVVCLL